MQVSLCNNQIIDKQTYSYIKQIQNSLFTIKSKILSTQRASKPDLVRNIQSHLSDSTKQSKFFLHNRLIKTNILLQTHTCQTTKIQKHTLHEFVHSETNTHEIGSTLKRVFAVKSSQNAFS